MTCLRGARSWRPLLMVTLFGVLVLSGEVSAVRSDPSADKRKESLLKRTEDTLADVFRVITGSPTLPTEHLSVPLSSKPVSPPPPPPKCTRKLRQCRANPKNFLGDWPTCERMQKEFGPNHSMIYREGPALHNAMLVVPHGNYKESGNIAEAGYRWAREAGLFDRVIVVGFYHIQGFSRVVVGDCDSTDSTNSLIDHDGVTRLRNFMDTMGVDHCPADGKDGSGCFEHSLEQHLPLIEYFFGSNRNNYVIPIMIGAPTPFVVDKLTEGLTSFLSETEKRTLVVFSSDLSHGFPDKLQKQHDDETIDAVVQMKPEMLETMFILQQQDDEHRNDGARSYPCGRGPIMVAVQAAANLEFVPKVIARGNSAGKTGNKSKVVGYAAIGFMPSPGRLVLTQNKAGVRIAAEAEKKKKRLQPVITTSPSLELEESTTGKNDTPSESPSALRGSNSTIPANNKAAQSALAKQREERAVRLQSILEVAEFEVTRFVCMPDTRTSKEQDQDEGEAVDLARIILGKAALEEDGIMVTLWKNAHNGLKDLRGCIGCLRPGGCFGLDQQTLAPILIAAADSVSLYDPRYEPVTVEELPALTVEVAVVHKFKRVGLNDIKFGDGVVMHTKDGKEGLFLPSVWLNLQHSSGLQGKRLKEHFLNTLATEKAHVDKAAWHDPETWFEVFGTETITGAFPLRGCGKHIEAKALPLPEIQGAASK